MWFRNLQLFHLKSGFDVSAEQLEQALSGQSFQPCGSLQAESMGWVPPLGSETTALVHAVQGRLLVCARREERLLPASVVREEVDERAAAIEAAEGRTVGRKERNQIRDEVEMTLLPRAFTRSRHVFAYIDPAAGWLIVDAASRKRAEDITVLLRESLGSFAVVPPVTVQPPLAVLTHWLQEGGTDDFDLGDECELRDESDEGGVIRCRKLAIDDDEILAHVRAGKRVSRLALHFGERLSCVLGDDLSIKRLKFLDMVQDAAAEVEAEGHAARMDADFVLMAAELAPFLDAVVAGFGGLQPDAVAAP